MISRRLVLLGALMCGGLALAAEPILLAPAEGAKEGRALVAEMLSQKPSQNTTSKGVLKIRDAAGKRRDIPFKFELALAEAGWKSVYETTDNEVNRVKLTVDCSDPAMLKFLLRERSGEKTLAGNETMISFAGSDFWIADLGLEFLRWPEQRVLRKEIRRGQSCSVLESINPNPASAAYRRVVSWVDLDSNGIMNAEAYDFKNKLLKEFAVKRFKKVEGQWQLQEMEISNRQAGSWTRIEFDLQAD
jgi:hypothetical protein